MIERNHPVLPDPAIYDFSVDLLIITNWQVFHDIRISFDSTDRYCNFI